ncbi:hypothetical protein GQ43DRAFT_444763 [Delitschia confertaspora ATCC 74209]|uniref:Uncharacterized protein n=1 Tax=Delitschia confertaspora ATCC 74209 TaxID=1513339 RepID=A0A9P4JCV5_9PLEO|nr:hypothetical protein GQ43DRAFT_444763 [Delitschia confertaspora ATCC 74209]
MDEAAEREEQEIIARREQVLMDLAAAQDAVAARQQAEQGEDDEIGEGEHDLDDDVPEAEESFSEVSNDSEDDIVTEEGDTVEENSQIEAADLTFNDESFIEGSMVQAEVEHMLEMEEAEMAGVLQEERDLDDDIPEAGSYEHTDTELTEDLSSSEPEEDSFAHRASTGRRRSRRRSSGVRPQRSSGVGPQHRGGRSSITNEQNSSIMDSSSFLRSSPAAARGADIASTFRSRFMGSRAPRGS